MDNKAEREWQDWQRLMNYFMHEIEENEITSATYESMTGCLMTFKPHIEVNFEGKDNG